MTRSNDNKKYKNISYGNFGFTEKLFEVNRFETNSQKTELVSEQNTCLTLKVNGRMSRHLA